MIGSKGFRGVTVEMKGVSEKLLGVQVDFSRFHEVSVGFRSECLTVLTFF